MSPTILITSFDIWEAHHRSNSSDDLLEELLVRGVVANRNIHLLRRMPVDFQLAPEQTIATIERLQPDLVICCGMAEKRSLLTIESNGKLAEKLLHTRIDLMALIQDLEFTDISHDAGQFVCNYLYYSVLNYIYETQKNIHCVFIHVPLLTLETMEVITQDFCKILERLTLVAMNDSSRNAPNLSAA